MSVSATASPVHQLKEVMVSSTSSINSGEIVYGTGGSIAGSDESRVMSEKVQQLASSIYKEFETMLQKWGEGAVKDLMPLVVNVLESLDLAYLEKEEHEVEVELLKEDNEQLVTQYEREKQLRRSADQKCLEIEDHFDSEHNELTAKVESLESIVRMLELKAKNASDHSNRLEERESEMKQEYTKLHERYTDLFKTHMDYMERTKMLMGSDKYDGVLNAPAGDARARIGLATSMEAAALRGVSDMNNKQMTKSLPPNAANTLASEIAGGEWSADELTPSTAEEIFAQSTDKNQSGRISESDSQSRPPLTPREGASEGPADDSLGADFTGALVDPAEFASADSETSDLEDKYSRPESWREGNSLEDSGMGREVENLIKENTELLETKNALNVVKNDLIAKLDELSSEQDILRQEILSLEMLRTKLTDRVKELEEEGKTQRDELEKLKNSKEDEDDVPMAQRKRFTRVEMARVLMERNQYKEKLFELQEALKWTEMMRASKAAENSGKHTKKKGGGIWDFFSNLLGSPETSSRPKVRYSQSTTFSQQPGTDPMTRRKGNAASERRKALDFLDPEYSSEKRAAERREQYRLVKAHVKKDESGRLQAYGWSIPAIDSNAPTVPVPIYCRPLMDQEPSLKIWCAAGVVLTGGRTKDGGFLVGGSTFYSKPGKEVSPAPPAHQTVDLLDYELRKQQKEYRESCEAEWEMSSLLWVCSSAHGQSQVAVVDANNPGDVLEAFTVCSSHLLCVASVPGTKETDYPVGVDVQSSLSREVSGDEESEAGKVVWVPLSVQADGMTYYSPSSATGASPNKDSKSSAKKQLSHPLEDSGETSAPTMDEDTEKPSGVSKIDSTQRKVRSLPPHIKDGLSKYEGIATVTTLLPTVWMGSQNQFIYIHSSVAEWRRCLCRVKIKDAVLSIVQHKGRVFAALANGTIAAFHRNQDGDWSMEGYHVITVGRPQHSVRCLTVVAGRIWCGYRNKIYVFNAETFALEVRQLVWIGDGVWCSIRLDSTLRLYHAHTYAHMQDVDIEPYVSKMLGTSKLGFSFTRITALSVSCKRLWIGTGNGVIISVPLSETNETKIETTDTKEGGGGMKGPGGLVRVYSDPSTGDKVVPGTFLPYCNMTHAQLSFHGHKDAVKFFVSVPGPSTTGSSVAGTDSGMVGEENKESKSSEEKRRMVVSGGDGYIDFRVGDEEEEEDDKKKGMKVSPRDLSHLIVWEVFL